jgi:hypothetical protein
LLAVVADPVWFCLRAQPKREHCLQLRCGVDLRSSLSRLDCASARMTQRGPVWFVEAMFRVRCRAGHRTRTDANDTVIRSSGTSFGMRISATPPTFRPTVCGIEGKSWKCSGNTKWPIEQIAGDSARITDNFRVSMNNAWFLASQCERRPLNCVAPTVFP